MPILVPIDHDRCRFSEKKIHSRGGEKPLRKTNRSLLRYATPVDDAIDDAGRRALWRLRASKIFKK
jgi:hypothetical protein